MFNSIKKKNKNKQENVNGSRPPEPTTSTLSNDTNPQLVDLTTEPEEDSSLKKRPFQQQTGWPQRKKQRQPNNPSSNTVSTIQWKEAEIREYSPEQLAITSITSFQQKQPSIKLNTHNLASLFPPCPPSHTIHSSFSFSDCQHLNWPVSPNHDLPIYKHQTKSLLSLPIPRKQTPPQQTTNNSMWQPWESQKAKPKKITSRRILQRRRQRLLNLAATKKPHQTNYLLHLTTVYSESWLCCQPELYTSTKL